MPRSTSQRFHVNPATSQHDHIKNTVITTHHRTTAFNNVICARTNGTLIFTDWYKEITQHKHLVNCANPLRDMQQTRLQNNVNNMVQTVCQWMLHLINRNIWNTIIVPLYGLYQTCVFLRISDWKTKTMKCFVTKKKLHTHCGAAMHYHILTNLAWAKKQAWYVT
jgi:hypothetical protein